MVSPLHGAVTYGHVERVRLLIREGYHVDARDDGEYTLLVRAARQGRTGCVRALLAAGGRERAGHRQKNGADMVVNALDNFGDSVLRFTTPCGCTECKRRLVVTGVALGL